MSLIERLSLAALALPGLLVGGEAQAGRAEELYHADFQYAHYEESKGRMKVDVFELSAVAPIGDKITASVDLVRDTISGASPILNIKNSDGKVEQYLSGASIFEQRDALAVGLSYAFDDVNVSFGGGVSGEHDYLSRYLNTGASWTFNKKLTTLSFTASVAFDEITPTGQSDVKNSKTSQKYLMGITQVINKNSLLQSNMTFAYHKGYLSDPYKAVYVEGVGLEDDSRPRHKFQWAWLTRYVHYFKTLNKAALHADYRLYVDDWGINGHTLELSWHQPIADDWLIIPRFRYYTQNEANFYQATFDAMDIGDIHSSDYRLTGFGTLGVGLKLTKSFHMAGYIKEVKLQMAADYNDRKASYQIGGNDEGSFDDFSFYMITASINMRF